MSAIAGRDRAPGRRSGAASALPARSAMTSRTRIIERLHRHGHGVAGAVVAGRRRPMPAPVGAACGGRQRLTERQAHGGDLLLLVDDDLLGDAAELLVVAVAQFGLGHLDGALVVRDHHGGEIGVDVAGRLDRHAVHHLAHGGLVGRQERLFIRKLGSQGPTNWERPSERCVFRKPGNWDSN